MEKHYVCDKENVLDHGYIDSGKLDGFRIKPRNKVKYDGVEVNKLLLIKPELIENVLKRKTHNQLNMYMNFLLSVLDDDDDTDPGDVDLVIEDAIRYKSVIINRYSKYLKKADVVSIVSKVGFIEDELKEKVSDYSINYTNSKGRGR